jgi:hypothetical protein
VTRRIKPLTIDRALLDGRLLGAGLGDPASWRVWLTILRAAFGLPLDDDEHEVFRRVAGGRSVPSKRVSELWCLAGRRSGKSRMAAALGVYFAAFVQHKLAAGEVGMVLILAGTVDQAKVVFHYVRGFIAASPLLRGEVAVERASELILKNGISIGVHSNSFRSIRGRTLCAAIFDEVAFWRDAESVSPDIEVYTAIKPALMTLKGPLIGISSPYRKHGLMHGKHRDHFGVDGDVLVVQAASTVLNPSLDDEDIAAQRAIDPAAARSEWDAEFRQDISAYLDEEVLEQAVDHGRPLELPPRAGVFYVAHVDAAGGVGADSYTVAISHREDETLVVDVVRGTAGKFDPAAVTRQYAALLREYGISRVKGDAYAAEWVAGSWRECGTYYERSELPKSGIYLECIPLFARGLVRLPDHPRLVHELRLLERHTHRSGRDVVDHGKGAHDDHANAACGSLIGLLRPQGVQITSEFLQRMMTMPPSRSPELRRRLPAISPSPPRLVIGGRG